MIWRVLAVLLSLGVGGWMMADGVHCLVRGKYIGPEKPGPWAAIFTAVGVDPFRVAPVFVVLGAMWLVAVAWLMSASGGMAQVAWWLAMGVAVASLWYLPVGTVLAVGFMVVLVLGRAAFVGG